LAETLAHLRHNLGGKGLQRCVNTLVRSSGGSDSYLSYSPFDYAHHASGNFSHCSHEGGVPYEIVWHLPGQGFQFWAIVGVAIWETASVRFGGISTPAAVAKRA